MEVNEIRGTFMSSLTRNNKKIRADRAAAITEDAETIYRREVEDLEIRLKKAVRERENLLDLSPNSTQSLIMAADFDSKGFSTSHINLGLQIKKLEEKLEVARTGYAELFSTGVEQVVD